MNQTVTQGVLLSQEALAHIKKRVSEQLGAIGMRLSVKRAGCSGYQYDAEVITQKIATDVSMAIDDQLTLFIDQKSFPLFEGVKIDYVKQGLLNKRLVFINPREKGRCGCGESVYM